MSAHLARAHPCAIAFMKTLAVVLRASFLTVRIFSIAELYTGGAAARQRPHAYVGSHGTAASRQ